MLGAGTVAGRSPGTGAGSSRWPAAAPPAGDDVYRQAPAADGTRHRPAPVAAPADEPPGRPRRAGRAGRRPGRGGRALVPSSHEPAAGEDVYAGCGQLGLVRPRRPRRRGGADARAPARRRQPTSPTARRSRRPGFVVQLGAVEREPVDAVERLAALRPAVADHLAGRDWRAAVDGRLRRAVRRGCGRISPALPERPLHGDWQTNNLFFAGDEVSGHHRLPPGRLRPARARPGRRRSSATASSGTGSRPATTRAFDLRQAELLVRSLRRAVRRSSRPSGRRSPTCSPACQFEYGISFLDYYWGVERDREKADWAWRHVRARPRQAGGARRRGGRRAERDPRMVVSLPRGASDDVRRRAARAAA